MDGLLSVVEKRIDMQVTVMATITALAHPVERNNCSQLAH
jgi:hypothetical protein